MQGLLNHKYDRNSWIIATGFLVALFAFVLHSMRRNSREGKRPEKEHVIAAFFFFGVFIAIALYQVFEGH
jgi:hypothetical protein